MALLTAEDILNKKFAATKFREGYDVEEVDDFLDEVVRTLTAVQEENDDLRSKLTAAEHRVGELSRSDAAQQSQPTPTPAPAPHDTMDEDEDEDDDCEAVYAPIDDDNADSKLSKSAPPDPPTMPDPVDDAADVVYQSGCGATVPV